MWEQDRHPTGAAARRNGPWLGPALVALVSLGETGVEATSRVPTWAMPIAAGRLVSWLARSRLLILAAYVTVCTWQYLPYLCLHGPHHH